MDDKEVKDYWRSTSSTDMQIEPRKRSTGRRELVVHDILAYVANWETAAKDIIHAAMPRQSGKSAQSSKSEGSALSIFNGGEL
jgi:hypothetical protein